MKPHVVAAVAVAVGRSCGRGRGRRPKPVLCPRSRRLNQNEGTGPRPRVFLVRLPHTGRRINRGGGDPFKCKLCCICCNAKSNSLQCKIQVLEWSNMFTQSINKSIQKKNRIRQTEKGPLEPQRASRAGAPTLWGGDLIS